MNANRFEISFQSDENVLKLDSDDSMTVIILKPTESYTLKWCHLWYMNYTQSKKVNKQKN